MRLKVAKSKKSTRLYAIKSTYDPKSGKTSSKVAANLGTAEQIMEEEDVDYEEALKIAKERVARLSADDKAEREAVTLRLRPDRRLKEGGRRRVNAGYLFPKKALAELGLRRICEGISEKSGFEYDLGEILEHLVVGRLLSPSSKAATARWCRRLVEVPRFADHQVYRALSVLAGHSDEIQAALYKSSAKLCRRRSGVLYYDCTNFFFEIDQEDESGLRRYGLSKEHRPNPIVEMGLFTDAEGIPLAFRISAGNRSEQTTMTPLEETILEEFGHSRFVVCTDAGLSSKANREFNTEGERAFITVQSVKKLKGDLREWALDRSGWKLFDDGAEYHLHEIDEVARYDDVFYKERVIKDEAGFEQRLIATFSFRHMEYQAAIREGQIERAVRKASEGASIERRNPNDPARFVAVEHVTDEGELASRAVAFIDEAKIANEARYDGISCVATSLFDDKAGDIVKVNSRRWQIEECFRIMKSDLRARPVYLSRTDRIEAHFLTCFIALLVYRLMDSRLGGAFTCGKLLSALRNMDLLEIPGEGWLPAFEPNEITDALRDAYGIEIDREIVTNRQMRSALARSKDPKPKNLPNKNQS